MPMAAASIQKGDLIVRVRVRGELGRGEGRKNGCVSANMSVAIGQLI